MATKKKAVPTRAEEFFKTGATLAAKIGIANVTRRAIAEAHDVSDPLVGKHVGGKAELQAGIKKTLKRLGLKEPTADVIAKKGEELRSRGTKKPVAKKAAKKVIKKAAKKVAAKKSVAAPAKKRASSAPVKSPAVPAKPADPKKGAPSRKVVKKAPSNKAKFPPKLPPLPALPTL